MVLRYFQVTIDNNNKTNAKGDIVETGFIYPEGWDSHKINVKAYKSKVGGAEYCIVEIDDKNLDVINKLLQNIKVSEITIAAAAVKIEDARPTIHVHISLDPKAEEVSKGIQKDLEDLLKAKGLTYIIR